jgi:hypothetical protein
VVWPFIKRRTRRWVGGLSLRGKLYLLIALIVLAGMAVELFGRWAG